MNDKEQVAKYAASLVKDGMVVGLGTGSTADYFITELAYRVKNEALKITTVSSSLVSTVKAQQYNLPLITIEHLTTLDLYVDGADEVTADNTLLKGQGADLVKEKILAKACNQFIVLIDQSKIVNCLGEHFSIPIEVLPFSYQLVKKSIEGFGAYGELRKSSNGSGYVVSSQGNLILDMIFKKDLDANQLNTILNNIPGIVEHGIFYQLADIVLLAIDGKIKEIVI